MGEIAFRGVGAQDLYVSECFLLFLNVIRKKRSALYGIIRPDAVSYDFSETYKSCAPTPLKAISPIFHYLLCIGCRLSAQDRWADV